MFYFFVNVIFMTFLDFVISQFKYLVFLRPKSSNSKREDFTYNNLNLNTKQIMCG